MAVLPSSDNATEAPCLAFPTAPLPTSLLPCWVQTPLLRVKTHAAPVFEVSYWLRVFLFLAREEQREGAGFEEMQC
jgi:hypothetical protein